MDQNTFFIKQQYGRTSFYNIHAWTRMKKRNEKLKRQFDQCDEKNHGREKKNVFIVCGFGSRRQ